MVGRVAAVAAVVVAAVAVGVVLLGSSDSARKYNLVFQNAGQLVKGNLVQVSGRAVGEVEEITLTDNGQAKVRIAIADEDYHLREGTQATIRMVSLSGIANRYIDLQLAPASARELDDGSTIGVANTTTAVDLDQLFNVFDRRTRRALSGVIRGFGTTYSGREQQANAATVYFNPALASTTRLFAELTRDEEDTRRFVNRTANLVTHVNERRADLAGLISNLAATTTAIGNQRDALAEAIARLPDFMRRANTTFVNLRATLDDLDPLVAASKPVAPKLRRLLAELRPLARNARPTIQQLSVLIRRLGPSNDLIDLTRSNVPVRDIAIGPVRANGRMREGAFPASTRALQGAAPELSFARPYAPDLMAWFNDFSQTGYYDANGAVGRVALNVNAFRFVNGFPLPGPINDLLGGTNQTADVLNELTASGALATNQTRRCPGSMERPAPDGSNPFRAPDNDVCDPSQLPPGP